MKKLFLNDRYFLISVVFAVIGQLCIVIKQMSLPTPDLALSLPLTAFAISEIILYTSFKKHEKNVMKGIMGALLMGHFTLAASILSFADPAVRVFSSLHIILIAAMTFNHFLLNSERRSNEASVWLNQIFAVTCFLNVLAWMVYNCISDFSAGQLLSSVAGILWYTGVMSALICVESRLDAYRHNREAAGWTEEAGYPEGYVHEYQKK